jgi:hypothetical protein
MTKGFLQYRWKPFLKRIPIPEKHNREPGIENGFFEQLVKKVLRYTCLGQTFHFYSA